MKDKKETLLKDKKEALDIKKDSKNGKMKIEG
jgi:hypothetical protein